MKIKNFQFEPNIQTFDDTGKNLRFAEIFKHGKQKILTLEKRGCGVFWCINPQGDLTKRSIENTKELRVIGLDCDIAKEKDSKDIDRKKLKLELFNKLVGLPLPPSGIIETKNGLQPYWYFNPAKQL